MSLRIQYSRVPVRTEKAPSPKASPLTTGSLKEFDPLLLFERSASAWISLSSIEPSLLASMGPKECCMDSGSLDLKMKQSLSLSVALRLSAKESELAESSGGCCK